MFFTLTSSLETTICESLGVALGVPASVALRWSVAQRFRTHPPDSIFEINHNNNTVVALGTLRSFRHTHWFRVVVVRRLVTVGTVEVVVAREFDGRASVPKLPYFLKSVKMLV